MPQGDIYSSEQIKSIIKEKAKEIQKDLPHLSLSAISQNLTKTLPRSVYLWVADVTHQGKAVVKIGCALPWRVEERIKEVSKKFGFSCDTLMITSPMAQKEAFLLEKSLLAGSPTIDVLPNFDGHTEFRAFTPLEVNNIIAKVASKEGVKL